MNHDFTNVQNIYDFIHKKKRNKPSKIDEFYPIIAGLLSEDSIQVFYYRRNLWQYLKDNHKLDCAQSTFRHYIANTPEFQAYFDKDERIPSMGNSGIRLETRPGKQA